MKLTRRGFLVLGGAGVVAGAAATAAAVRSADRPTAAVPTSTTVAGQRQAGGGAVGSRWSDPGSWSDGVPGPGQVAVVTKPIVLDVDAQVAGVRIEPDGRLSFDPQDSRRLTSDGNVVVHGQLVMRPASAEVEHRLVLTGAQEAKFAGGGMEVLDEDIGVWVMDRGTLDLAGTPKLAWDRVTAEVRQGATTITLRVDPKGWRTGDEIMLTPTLEPTVSNHSLAFDTARIRAISGRTVTLDRATRFAHPALDLGTDIGANAVGGRLQTAEVANLSRNVAIEGTPKGRSHVFINSSRRQSVQWATIRHVGPRKYSRDDAHGPLTALVSGRYGLHFHMCHNGSRGSRVEGVIVRDAGSRAFVAHESHGVTFRNCIAFDVMEQAYWWDGAPGTMTGGAWDPGTISDDVVYERCMAALVRTEPTYEGYDVAGFTLGRGTGNVCRDCVAVGVQGNVNATGYQWGENQEGPGLWNFRNCVAHNNARHGIFWWQTTGRHHTVFDFVAYRNGGSGILNGSYGDNNHFERCVLVQNRETQFFGWAVSGEPDRSDPAAVALEAADKGAPQQATPQHLVNSYLHCGGLSDFACILAGRSVVESENSVGQVVGNVLKGARKACVGVTFDFHDHGPYRARWRLQDNTYEGNQYWFDDSSHEGTEVESEAGMLRRSDQAGGVLRSAWNARIA